MMERIKGIQRDVIIPGKIARSHGTMCSVLNDPPSINDVANSHLVPRAGMDRARGSRRGGWR